jgi:hypothetical protein
MTRTEILDRYRHLRAISTQHHNAALAFVARPTILEHAKRLGLAAGKALIADNHETMTLLFDLNLYTAKEGRSRALDRYARAAKLAPGSDEAHMLDAMRHPNFSIWRLERKHEAAGLVVTDLLREREEWLVDENLERSAPNDAVFAARVCKPESFAMTCGVVVPLTSELIEKAMHSALAGKAEKPEQLALDPRFATALYRAAIDSGIMNHVAYE